MLDPLPQDQWTRRTADHLLSRLAFLGSPQQRDGFFQLGKNSGVGAAVDSLIDPVTNWSAYPLPPWTATEQGLLENHANGNAYHTFARWYMDQLFGATPAAAKMIKFWMDHFACTVDMVMTDPERVLYMFQHVEIMRAHALGHVKALTNSIYKGGLLMFMLDLHISTVGSVNENFGRELLELFTVGVDGGYTEQDVAACSGAFTGHRLDYYNYPYAYFYDPAKADMTSKAFLGTSVVTGDDAMDAIFTKIECAHHLCWKLWRYFVAPVPDAALLQALALRFRDVHGYQVIPLLKDIFKSEEFYAEAHIGRQIKDPADWVLTATKSLETTLLPKETLLRTVHGMGYEPHRPPNIAGWPEPIGAGNLWLSTANLLFRVNVPAAFTHRDRSLFPGSPALEHDQYPDLDFDAIAPPDLRGKAEFPILLERLRDRLLPFHRLRGAQVRALFDAANETRAAAGELEAVKDVIRLIMALPEYQMQ